MKEGYQPTKGKLDVTKPPQGGSGVPPVSPKGEKSTFLKELEGRVKRLEHLLENHIQIIQELAENQKEFALTLQGAAEATSQFAKLASTIIEMIKVTRRDAGLK